MTFSADKWFDAQAAQRNAFLERHGCAADGAVLMGRDCATRRYWRVAQDGKNKGGDTNGRLGSAVLMESLPDHHDHALAGHKLSDFIRIAAYLKANDIAVPDIYAADEAQGFVLIEDFGDCAVRRRYETLQDTSLYEQAVETAAQLNTLSPSADLLLPDYYDSHVHRGRIRVVDWYMPAVQRRAVTQNDRDSYLQVWDEIEAGLPSCPTGFLHVDFHTDNLMWRGDGVPFGVLDFQGAMHGPVMYDVVNLLEDARYYMPRAMRDALRAQYIAKMEGLADPDILQDWYRVLGTQFHCRVLGQFIRIAVMTGRRDYLRHLPVLQRYMDEALEDPLLAPLRAWFTDQHIDFKSGADVDPEDVRNYIGAQAF
ncbi:MAG: phosphotransferase [Alphaproteobacteria bacterium]|jgi:hypothetical protein|nr:phosphotransferase [Alphaproteobacteria bacterium]MDP7222030.1 phosphotransferase [Alphaproteobacteria bacterium]